MGFESSDLHPWIKNIWKKFPESSKKQNLTLLPGGNHLYSIYIVFIAIYIAFTLYLGIIGNLEMIWSVRMMCGLYATLCHSYKGIELCWF